jgi:hypothetical protein
MGMRANKQFPIELSDQLSPQLDHKAELANTGLWTTTQITAVILLVCIEIRDWAGQLLAWSLQGRLSTHL